MKRPGKDNVKGIDHVRFVGTGLVPVRKKVTQIGKTVTQIGNLLEALVIPVQKVDGAPCAIRTYDLSVTAMGLLMLADRHKTCPYDLRSLTMVSLRKLTYFTYQPAAASV